VNAIISHKSEAKREMRKTSDSIFDRICKYYFNQKTNVKLTAQEEAIRERWDFAWKLLANMYTRRQVTDALVQTYQVHKTVAYDDLNKCMMLFGDPRQSNKDAKRALSEEWITKGIKKAWDDQDLDAYERLIGRYNKLNKLESENDIDTEDLLANFKPHQVFIVASMEQLQAEVKKLQEDLVLDIPHEEEQ